MANQQNKRTWAAMLILILSWTFLLLIGLSSTLLDETLETEARQVEHDLGEDSARYVYSHARQWYQFLMVDSGAYRTLHRTMIPDDREKQRSRGMTTMGERWFDWVEGRLDAVVRLIYLFLARLWVLVLWLSFVPILLLPAIYDGWQVRCIKRTNFDYASPVVHKYAVTAVKLLLAGLGIVMTLPFALSPITFPIILIVVGLFSGLSVANIQKRL